MAITTLDGAIVSPTKTQFADEMRLLKARRADNIQNHTIYIPADYQAYVQDKILTTQ